MLGSGKTTTRNRNLLLTYYNTYAPFFFHNANSILGAGATIGVVCITVGVSSSELINKAIETTSSTHKLVDWSKVPLSLATISFAYGGNVVYPHVEASMARPRSWPRALWAALSFCFAMYTLIAVVGYLAFGAGTQNPVLKNLPRGMY